MTIETLGIDLGKTLCSVAGLDRAGAVVVALPCKTCPIARPSIPRAVLHHQIPGLNI